MTSNPIDMTILNGIDRCPIHADYASRYRCDTFIETGTGDGQSLREAMKWAKYLYSIEIDWERYVAAQNDDMIDDRNVSVYHGDSAHILPRLLPFISRSSGGHRPLFWLDAHSDDITLPTPILHELAAIIAYQSDSVILIDDAHQFGHGQWPTLETIRSITAPLWDFECTNAIVRLTPK